MAEPGSQFQIKDYLLPVPFIQKGWVMELEWICPYSSKGDHFFFFFRFTRGTQRYLEYIAHVCTTVFTSIHAVYNPDIRISLFSRCLKGSGTLSIPNCL